MAFNINNLRVGVIGLGYVGLPLAVEFGKYYPTAGFDINASRIAELEAGNDVTLEVTADEIAASKQLAFTSDPADLADCNFYVVTVPTPISNSKRPLLTPLKGASETIGSVLKQGDVVVYESTVYPGATEEYCVPILERESGLTLNEDFYAGYSPERINPGDKQHRLPSDSQGDGGLDTRGGRLHRCGVRVYRRSGHAQGVEHQGGGSRQGDRKHAARCQHRADQRTGDDLRAPRHRHRGSARGGRARSGTSCRSGPASSAGTASASTRTT